VLFVNPSLGSWQYIADMPFGVVTKATMWKILWLLHQGNVKQAESYVISYLPPAEECCDYVRGKEFQRSSPEEFFVSI